MHQSISLQTCRKSCIAAGTGATQFRIPTWPFTIHTNAIHSNGIKRTKYAAKCQLFNDGLQHTHEPKQSTVVGAQSIVDELESDQSIRHIVAGNTAASIQSIGRCKLKQSRHTNGYRFERRGPNQLSRATVLGNHCLLRTELPCRRSVSLQFTFGDR